MKVYLMTCYLIEKHKKTGKLILRLDDYSHKKQKFLKTKIKDLISTDYYAAKLEAEEHDKDGWFSHNINGHEGHLMTIPEWLEACEEDAFNDDDGYGDVMNINYEVLYDRSPSERDQLTEDAKYILWYNR